MKHFCLCLGIMLMMVGGSASATTVRILPLGDSLTAGYTNPSEWTIPFTFGYRGPLYTKLTDVNYDFQYVGTSGEPWNFPFGTGFGSPTVVQGPDLRTVGQDNHRGYGGATTSQILNGGVVGGSTNTFPSAVGMLNTDSPDIVLLMIGTNGIPDAMSNIDTLVNSIVTTKPNTQLIVAQIPPRATGGTGPTDPTVLYNDYIKNTVVPKYQALGNHVTTVDQFANFLAPGGGIDTSLFAPDGAHLRPAGYQLMAQTWFDGIQAVTPILPDPGPVVTGTYTAGVNPPVLPANNLIAQGSSTFSSSFAGGTAPAAFGSQLPGGMNDGVMTDADVLPILAWDNVTTDFGWAVYELDTATNPLGYDVSEILSYAGWIGARINQTIEIKYALVGETVTAGSELSNTLGTFSFAPSDNSTPYAYSTMSIAHNTDPAVLSGISAIQVKYLDNMFDGNTGSVVDPGNFTAYKQFAVIGTPTAPGLSGDFDLDGDVDGADFMKWQRDLAPDSVSLAAWEAGFGTVSPLVAAATGVPEPSTMTTLIGLCLVKLFCLRNLPIRVN